MLVVTSGGWKEPDGPGALKTPKPADDRGVRRTGGWVGGSAPVHPPPPGRLPQPAPRRAAGSRGSGPPLAAPAPPRGRGRGCSGRRPPGPRWAPPPGSRGRAVPGCRQRTETLLPGEARGAGGGGGGAGPPAGVPAHPRLAAGGLGQFLGCSSCDGSSLERSSVICRRGESAGARPVTSRGKNTGGEVGAGLGTASRVPGDVRGFPPSGAVDWGCWVRPPRMVLRQVRQGRPRCFRLLVA